MIEHPNLVCILIRPRRNILTLKKFASCGTIIKGNFLEKT